MENECETVYGLITQEKLLYYLSFVKRYVYTEVTFKLLLYFYFFSCIILIIIKFILFYFL